jgi:tripartite-type tricarboxylate transporter receptor subunit TctC
MKEWAAIGAMVCVALAVSGAVAEEWPDRSVRVVVPYAPGGGVDSFSRPIAQRLQEQTGQTFVILNRAGAGGTIGVLTAAQSPNDGYTLLSGGVHQPMAEALYPKRGYRIDADFVPIAITAVVSNVLVVNPEAGLPDVKTLIAKARAAPNSITYCTSGSGTSQHVIAEMFLKEMGLHMVAVHYRGTAPAMNDLLGNHCSLMFDGMGTSAGQIAAGRLKPLALTSAQRSKLFPDIPTMEEAGGPKMDAGTWYAIWAPRGTPQAIIERLRGEIRKALTAPEVKRFWNQQGAELGEVPDGDLESYVRDETARWTRQVTALGLQAE